MIITCVVLELEHMRSEEGRLVDACSKAKEGPHAPPDFT